MAWAAVAGAAVGVAGGMLSGKSAKKAQAKQDALRLEAARGNLVSSQHYGNQLINQGNQYEEFAMRPGMITNGYGTAQMDPRTGQMRFDLNDQYGGLRNQMLGGAARVFDQAGSFDPKAHAAERYAAAQALLAPGDAQAESGLMQDLYNKGGFGLQTNKQMVGGGTASINPYVGTFMDARNTRNANMSYNSLREGEQYLDNILNRGYGMLGKGIDIDRLGSASMQDAMGYRNQFNNDYFNVLNMRRGGIDAHYKGEKGIWDAIAGHDAGFGDNMNSQMWAGGANQLQGMIGKVDWSKFGKSGEQQPVYLPGNMSGQYGAEY